jgi:hypothetical protein
MASARDWPVREVESMSTKKDYTDAEWKSITTAPFLAGLFITMADPSGLAGIAKEALAVGKALADTEAGSQPEIVASLVGALKEGGFSGRPELPDLPKGDLAATRGAISGHLKEAVSAIAARSPAEADAFKTWLVAAARKAAEAAKEGGFLGFGGTLVSEKEQSALAELATELGVKV